MTTPPKKENTMDRQMPDENIKDEVYVLYSPYVSCHFNPSPGAVRYIRADPISPALLAAMDETLAYFDEEFPNLAIDGESWFISDRARGLTVGMLRTLRGMFA